MSQPESAQDDTPIQESAGKRCFERDLSGRTVGDFQIERLLGRGGMGEVYLATQLSLKRPVALKVLRQELVSNPTYLSRFEVEATAVARLNHPNIVQVYACGSHDDLRFIAMEYVPGTNLREYLAKKGTIELAQALTIMRQAGQAIEAAGEIGLIHRDIKPENLLLPKKGQVKVADFGLCREQGVDALHLTQEGMTLGTPMYMSPEQVHGDLLDHRSDLYSLGVTYYHLLAGVPPFRAKTAVDLAVKHLREQPASLSVHRPDLPKELVALVMKLLEKDPGRRYQTAKEMLAELARIRESVALAAGAASTTETQTLNQALKAPSRPSARSSKSKRPGPLLQDRLIELRPGRRTTLAIVALGLVVGLLLGYSSRAPKLLAEGSPEPADPPALWLNPAWRSIPSESTPRAQLRYAQLVASPSDREAAWLAVSGHFPGDREWSLKAYTHLARHYLRRGEPDRLDALGVSLDRAEAREMERRLSGISRAGASALRGDLEAVREQLGEVYQNLAMLDPPLIELGLEVIDRALQEPSGSGLPTSTLRPLREALLEALRLEPFDRA